VVETPQGGLTSPPGVPISESIETLLLPVLPLKDLSLFPGGSLTVVTSHTGTLSAVQIGSRAGKKVLVATHKEGGLRDLHSVGTVATIVEDLDMRGGNRRIEVDGTTRGRLVNLVGADVLVAEVEPLDEGDPGDEWGPAVEALARYLHAHAELRSFLDEQRRSGDPMSWVNLACQHLPIAASARQRLLESNAQERCQRISRGLDALLRKESQG
jgi:ATP-dependent Lon protease